MEYDVNILIEKAKKVSQNAWAPYSNYIVGTALLTSSNKIYTGCNIENNGIQSICGERVAFCKALSEGEREFVAIAVVGKSKDENKFVQTLPCGYCRQFISEFCKPDFKIYTYNEISNKVNEYKLEELLPHTFKL